MRSETEDRKRGTGELKGKVGGLGPDAGTPKGDAGSPAGTDAAAEAAGRILDGPSPELIRSAYRLELLAAPALIPELALADLANAVTLVEDGHIPPAPGRRLIAALLELREVGTGSSLVDASRGDLVMNREAWLRERIGRDAGYLLVGRPRREASVVAYHLAVRRRLLALAQGIERLSRTLVDVASRHVRTLSVDYTYWQAAQPSTLAHALLAYTYPLERDAERLRAAFGRVNLSPAGAGCTNGSTIPVDRRALARQLGFDGVVIHARDANWQADLAVELTALATTVGLTLDRLAEDLLIWDTREFGFVELADRTSRVSLAMPQKKNPYALVFVRGATARLLGRLAGAAAVGKTASGQPDPRIYAQDEVPDSLELAEQGTALLAEVVGGLMFDRARLADGARRGYLAGNDLAEAIMFRCGLPFGTAHRIVGEAVRVALEGGRDEGGIDTRALDAAARSVTGEGLCLDDAAIREALDPERAVMRRTGIGGAAPGAVREMLADRRRAAAHGRRWIRTRSEAIARAETALVERARAIASGD